MMAPESAFVAVPVLSVLSKNRVPCDPHILPLFFRNPPAPPRGIRSADDDIGAGTIEKLGISAGHLLGPPVRVWMGLEGLRVQGRTCGKGCVEDF